MHVRKLWGAGGAEITFSHPIGNNVFDSLSLVFFALSSFTIHYYLAAFIQHCSTFHVSLFPRHSIALDASFPWFLTTNCSYLQNASEGPSWLCIVAVDSRKPFFYVCSRPGWWLSEGLLRFFTGSPNSSGSSNGFCTTSIFQVIPNFHFGFPTASCWTSKAQYFKSVLGSKPCLVRSLPHNCWHPLYR